MDVIIFLFEGQIQAKSFKERDKFVKTCREERPRCDEKFGGKFQISSSRLSLHVGYLKMAALHEDAKYFQARFICSDER